MVRVITYLDGSAIYARHLFNCEYTAAITYGRPWMA